MKRPLSLLTTVACLCGGSGCEKKENARTTNGQEKLEIQITKGGVSQTIEVSRDIGNLGFKGSRLTSIALPEGLTNLWGLYPGYNQLTSFTLPEGLTNLSALWLENNQLTNFTLLEGLTNLNELDLSDNQLTNFKLPEGFTRLSGLGLGGNQLTSLTLPEGLTNLERLILHDNQLTNLFLSPDTSAAVRFNLNLHISGNSLMSIRLPVGIDIDIRFDVEPEHYRISYYDVPSSP